MHVVTHQPYVDQCMMDTLSATHSLTHQSHMDVHNVNPTEP